jgi:hypothetical protein
MMMENKDPLTLKDFKLAMICFLIGGCMATGLLCLLLGIFYNAELNSVLDVIDKR